ncbi:MAG: glutamate--tRNA ligase [Oscillospiraceae bacterium]|nr:glutamate--tRNA ligase [Oscillospiraceae bacterium]
MMEKTPYSVLADELFPADLPAPEQLERTYPPRALPEGAAVTRFAPSPTGYLHIGHLLGAFVDRLLASQSGGVFLLRMEDTDKKREVEDGVTGLVNDMRAFGIAVDEGVTGPGEEKGEYEPYTQSQRKEIYHTYARVMTERGLAYPCFCSSGDLDELRASQENEGVNKGYYGKWARCRDLPLEEQIERLRAGEPYTLRLRSPGDASRKIVVRDLIRGKLELPEYDMDVVLLKASGIPTYHFAHAVDDHLMRVTHVVRSDEWLASLPLHAQLFHLLGFQPPKYAHIAPMMKLDPETGGKRKLSKRKDPESAVGALVRAGYPNAALHEYLLTLLNSSFEDWRRANPGAPLPEFPFSLKKMSASGALFDPVKLEDVSKNVISRMRSSQVYDLALAWARAYDPELAALLTRDPDYAGAMLAIDRDGAKGKPRKDLARWSQLREAYAYFFDELFEASPKSASNSGILSAYIDVYRAEDDKDSWFAGIKSICEPLGYCPEVKAYKADPAPWKGHVGDVSGAVRLAVTGRENTPDLWAIMRVLGEKRVLERLKAGMENAI